MDKMTNMDKKKKMEEPNFDNVMDKDTLKFWFIRGQKPTQDQFASWMDSYWHKEESLPMKSVYKLKEALKAKVNLSELPERINERTTVFFPVHALANSVNFTEDLTITGVAYNRNCKALIFIDKEKSFDGMMTDREEPIDMLSIEIEEVREGAGPVEIQNGIPLTQFLDKTVYVLASEISEGAGIDISLTLKKTNY
jgi:hypothetical protein